MYFSRGKYFSRGGVYVLVEREPFYRAGVGDLCKRVVRGGGCMYGVVCGYFSMGGYISRRNCMVVVLYVGGISLGRRVLTQKISACGGPICTPP